MNVPVGVDQGDAEPAQGGPAPDRRVRLLRRQREQGGGIRRERVGRKAQPLGDRGGALAPTHGVVHRERHERHEQRRDTDEQPDGCAWLHG
ncbi:MAG: hypothetical protein B7Z61_11450 [Acidobacteria bacterium 37-71-11]|nr:MAG: hypothetical protein B7Z61_11450 [Acidobacteria bacterium 37-71-11]